MRDLDDVDWKLLNVLQQDATLTNQELANRVAISAPTCLRRVRRLVEEGWIERQVAILSPDKLQAGLIAIVEITLDVQAAEALAHFEQTVANEPDIQQCYRVSTGPDFVLIVHVADMAAYHALVHRVFTHQENVRNVRCFFSVKRSKFDTRLPLAAAPEAQQALRF